LRCSGKFDTALTLLALFYLFSPKKGGITPPFSVKITKKQGEKEERRSREEKGLRLFPH
jgi:hypothetical protein